MATDDKAILYLDLTDKRGDLPDYDPSVRCKDHPNAAVEEGYGLAGGGLGIYTYCADCCVVLSKTIMKDDSDG